MSLTGALSNAITGLNAATRSAELVSTNLANVMTDGYARREIELGARYGTGSGGVMMLGVTRHQNPAIIAEFRMATSENSYNDTLSSFHTRLERLVGTSDNNASFAARLSEFEASLVAASSRPDLPARLDAVVHDANALARTLGEVSKGIQTMRTEADTSIGEATERLNRQLQQVAELNGQIAQSQNNGLDASGLKDHRQVLIDQISEWIPLKEVARDSGRVALYSVGGVQLVDGPAVELSFTQSNTIVPHMTQANGLLSGLSVNGRDVSTSSDNGPLRGGKLAALFEVRDTETVTAQTELDAIARDLVERFQDPSLDATRGAGDAGLLTDGGAAFDPADEVGLSARLAVNALADPDQGGASWRLRDGLGAATPGAAGNASLLQDYYSALGAERSIASGKFAGANRSAAQLGASFTGDIGANRLSREQELTFSATRASELEAMVQAEGVDSDQEMQKLMMIEQAYAANAQVLQTVDEMMDSLMRAI